MDRGVYVVGVHDKNSILMDKIEHREQFKIRTKQFALRIIKLFQALPKSEDAHILGKQLLRSATSVAANYRAACRARSKAEFFSKLSIVVEEADEVQLWLELLGEAGIVKPERLAALSTEATEILKIVSVARKNSKRKVREGLMD
jgi:four helix bundle protein